jgi:hypothetical protein
MGPTLAVPEALAASEAADNLVATAFGVLRSFLSLGPVIKTIWHSFRVDRAIPGGAIRDGVAEDATRKARPRGWYMVQLCGVNATPDLHSCRAKNLLV